jgi:Skp family chaperone for outer membrane proteins
MSMGHNILRSPVVAAAVIGLTVLGVVTVPTVANRMAGPGPTVVATVDLERLFDNLGQLKEENERLDKLNTARRGELQKLKEGLEARQKKIKELPRDDKIQIRREGAEFVQAEGFFKQQDQIYGQLAQLEFGDVIKDLYEATTKAVASYAEANGIDVVILDDSGVQLPDGAPQKTLNTIIGDRQVLYARKSVDITDAIRDMMNNAHAAGRK